MAESVGRTPAAWPDRVWRKARWALLSVLLLSFVTTLLHVVPAHGSTHALVTDIRAGRTHTVQTDAQGRVVTVRWNTGLLDDHSYVYRPTSFVAGTHEADLDLRATVDRAAGASARSVRFSEYDATYGAGGLSLLFPVGYVLLVPWTWLRLLVMSTGVVVLIRMITARRHRLATGPAWVLAALVTGAGFVGYLWVESGQQRSPAKAPHRRGAWLASLASAASTAALAATVLLAAGRL
ncbi:hypothetical protein ACIHEJ_33325 [Streptomyces sp. NPDC052301]|uniref:hypothetical protein n=1 Tax=Streptomyces sp. NPDC052301 TaxID=3365687 RepID=UPI0037D92700